LLPILSSPADLIFRGKEPYCVYPRTGRESHAFPYMFFLNLKDALFVPQLYLFEGKAKSDRHSFVGDSNRG